MAAKPPSLMAMIAPELQAVLAGRRLQVGHRVRGVRLGRHPSRRVGVGLEFREHRAYSPGDDLRRIDWRAVARRDRLVLRRDHSEDQLTLALLVDNTAALGEHKTPEARGPYVAALVAALAVIAVRQGDRLAFAVETGGESAVDQLRPRTGQGALQALAHALHQPLQNGPCPWLDLLERARTRLPSRSLVAVCSDFLDPVPGRAPDDRSGDLEVLEALGQLRARGHTVVLLQSLLRAELGFPWRGGRQLEVRAPGGRRQPVQGPGMHLRDSYLAGLGAHLAWVRATCEQQGVRLVVAPTDQPLSTTFGSVLAACAGQIVASTQELVG